MEFLTILGSEKPHISGWIYLFQLQCAEAPRLSFPFFSLFFLRGDHNNGVKDAVGADAWRAFQSRPIYSRYKMPVDSSTTHFRESFSLPFEGLGKNLSERRNEAIFLQGKRNGAGGASRVKMLARRFPMNEKLPGVIMSWEMDLGSG